LLAEWGYGLESQNSAGIPVQTQNKLFPMFKCTLCGKMLHEEMLKSLQLRKKKKKDFIFTTVNVLR
jgi:hypothetical protein